MAYDERGIKYTSVNVLFILLEKFKGWDVWCNRVHNLSVQSPDGRMQGFIDWGGGEVLVWDNKTSEVIRNMCFFFDTKTGETIDD